MRFNVSRLLVDPERFEHDVDEPMAGCGMGVIYTRTSDGRPLREGPDDLTRSRLLAEYYRPHHAELAAEVAKQVEGFGKALVIDCHSFPSTPRSYEPDQSTPRPEICIGTDAYHTPSWLADRAVRIFTTRGLSVKLNSPFAGTMVPNAYYRVDGRVTGVMIELNRSLYMDETTGDRLPTFGALEHTVAECLAELATCV